jgi:thiol-disulfide isomerase/thioredoxin
MKKKPNWILITGLSFAGLCLLGCMGFAGLALFFPSVYQYYLNSSSLAIGSTAPNFELTSLTGETFRLDQFRGGPVLLSLGATWCPDCRAEAPVLEEFHKAHPELTILMVDSKESPEVVQQFADEFGITHPILLDRDGTVMNLYQVFAIPTVLFIDAEGVIRAKVIEGVTPELLTEKLPLIGMSP